MIEISTIKDTLFQVAAAISSVIDVDVLIVDSRLVRLAGTGRLASNMRAPVDKGSVFAYAMKQGESFIIEDPRTHEACRACGQKETCCEQAELCCPIAINGEIAGVIGLIAFDGDAKKRLLARKDSYLIFVRQMAGLIASKALEVHQYLETQQMAKQLHTLVEEMVHGVFVTDNNGLVLHNNQLGYKLLNVSSGGNLKNVLPSICVMGSQLIPGRHTFITPSGRTRVLCTVKVIKVEDAVTGYLVMVEKLKDVLKTVNQVMGCPAHVDFKDIIGRSNTLQRSVSLGERAAKGDSTVLILGESGTGKELFARAIHGASSRRNEPFIPINCAAIPDHLLESELFGYEEGAFTGARKGGAIGKFEMADRGTLFLDEIGDMSLHLQAKLLRVLEERVLDKIGSRERIPINVRIIAATHQDLALGIKQKTFREDLFYRLNVIPLMLPPLRARKEDIPELSAHFIRVIADNRNMGPMALDKEAERILTEWSWPGNVRELQNTLSFALQMTTGNQITAGDLPQRFLEETENGLRGHLRHSFEKAVPSEATDEILELSVLEKRAIERAMTYYGKDVEGAAKALGISRATLYRKLKDV